MKLEVLGVEDWAVWDGDAGVHAIDAAQTVTLFILQGEAEIRAVDDEGGAVSVQEGDLVIMLGGAQYALHITKAIQAHRSSG